MLTSIGTTHTYHGHQLSSCPLHLLACCTHPFKGIIFFMLIFSVSSNFDFKIMSGTWLLSIYSIIVSDRKDTRSVGMTNQHTGIQFLSLA